MHFKFIEYFEKTKKIFAFLNIKLYQIAIINIYFFSILFKEKKYLMRIISIIFLPMNRKWFEKSNLTAMIFFSIFAYSWLQMIIRILWILSFTKKKCLRISDFKNYFTYIFILIFFVYLFVVSFIFSECFIKEHKILCKELQFFSSYIKKCSKL